MFDPKTREGMRETTIGFSDALAGPRRRHQQRDRRVRAAASRDLAPGGARTSRRAADRSRRVLPRPGSVLVCRGTRSRRRRPTCTSIWTPRSARSPRSRSHSCRTGSRETPPTFSTVITDSPSLQAFLLNTAGLFSELRPGFATLNQSAPVLADAFAAGTKNLPGTKAARRSGCSASSKSLESFRHDAGGHGGLDRLTADAQEPALAARLPDAGPVDVQLRLAVPAEHQPACWVSGSATGRRCDSTSS